MSLQTGDKNASKENFKMLKKGKIPMENVKKNSDDEITRISKINLHEIISHEEQLTTALYASSEEMIFHTFACVEFNSSPFIAAKKALVMKYDATVVSGLAANHYFEPYLLKLMVLAKSDPDIGSRLMPIFVFYANNYEEHNIPKELFDELIALMEKIRDTKGFAIMEIDGEGAEVYRVKER